MIHKMSSKFNVSAGFNVPLKYLFNPFDEENPINRIFN